MAYHLKTRIAIAVSCFAIILMLLISWVAHSFLEKEFKSATFNFISDSLSLTADHLSGRVQHTLHILELIRNSIPVEITDDREQMQKFLDNLGSEQPVFDNGLVLFSPEGTLLAVNPRQDDVIGMDFSFRDYIKYTRINRQPYISAPIKSRQKHQHPIIMLTEPVLDAEGNVVAILGGSIDLYSNNFLRSLVTNKIGKEGYYIMLDQNETMVVHPDKRNILRSARNLFPREQFIEFLLNSKGLIQKVTIDGREMIGAFQHISPLNWTLVALTPLSESYQPIKQARKYTAVAILIFFVLIILTVRMLTNRLTSPLTDLTRKVHLLAHNEDNSIKLESDRYEELGDLSESIQRLVTDLAGKRKGLNDQLSFLQNLVDTIPGPIFYKDAEYRYIGCNKAFETYIGIPRNDLIGKSVFEIAPPELARVYHQADIDLWEQGGEQVYEASVKYADDSIHDVIFYKKIFKDAEGSPAGMIGIFLDITERKQAELELQRSEQRFRLLVENAADSFFLHDENAQILDVNQQACNSLGYSREELLAMNVQDISIDHDLASIKSLQNLLKTEGIVTAEDRHRRKDGTALPVEVRLCRSDQAGGVTIALARDITERKRDEAILQNALRDVQTAKAQVDNILRSAADGIVVTDRQNRVTHINQIAEEMLNVKAEEITNQPFTRLFSNRELRDQARAFLKEDELESHDLDFKLNLSGTEFPRIIQARSSILRTEEDKQIGVVTLLRDVSRERELDQIKSEFISTAAHEMRTPMAVILGYIEMLIDTDNFGEFPEKQKKEFLSEAYRKGESLTRIIDDLFDISRIEAGLPLPIEKVECNLNSIILEVVSHYENHSSKHRFRTLLDNISNAPVDPNKITQVLENLISNAVKYSPGGGDINIKTSSGENTLHIEVEDHGHGMSEEQVKRVFDKFYRADSTNTSVTGLGLGMSIVKAIVEGHGGQIHVQSTTGKGTTVSLSLPLE